VKETIKESPGAMFGLLFRQIGQWLDHAFDDSFERAVVAAHYPGACRYRST
jgi:hypothetical protein